MSKLVFEENYHVYWLTTAPADPAAPTTTEIDAGDDITALIPKDGFAPGVTNNRVAAGDLSTTFNAEIMGSHSAALTVTAFMDDTTNTAFDSFGVRGATGAFVVTWRGASAADEPAFVYPDVQAGNPILPTTAADERQTFQAEFAVRATPNYHATVVAGV